MNFDWQTLQKKAQWVRRETLMLHRNAPETRLASSLSCVEILTVLYYSGLMHFHSTEPLWSKRDRMLISKGHGTISLYPILADLGFFKKELLESLCSVGSSLGSIPDPTIPGYESINGSLGHGLGVACGVGLALRSLQSDANIFVLHGDGELFEGAVWEAVMFAAQHALDKLILILDMNKRCMLGYCDEIINLTPIQNKFDVFGWQVLSCNGHDIKNIYDTIQIAQQSKTMRPKVIIAETIKGKGVPALETDPLCHIRMMKKEDVDVLLEIKSDE